MTETAIALRAVVSAIAPTLSAAGYRKRANAFNRVNDDGVVHVVSFQAGAYEFGHVSPLIGESLHGQFTLNLGVWVPRLVNAAGSTPTPTGPWVSEAYCQLRWRIGEFADDPHDIWWSTGDPDAADEVRALLTERALPQLAEIASEEDLLGLWESEHRSELPNRGALTLDFAGLYAARGDREAERRELSAHVDRLLADPPETHHHPASVVELLESAGYPELAEPLKPLAVPRVDV